jgi:hypothetical protein
MQNSHDRNSAAFSVYRLQACSNDKRPPRTAATTSALRRITQRSVLGGGRSARVKRRPSCPMTWVLCRAVSSISSDPVSLSKIYLLMVNIALTSNLHSTRNGFTPNGELSSRRGGTHQDGRTRVACQICVAKLFRNGPGIELPLRLCRPRRGQRSHSKRRWRFYSTASCVLRASVGSFASVIRFMNSTPSASSVRQIARHSRPSSRVICNTNSSGMVLARTLVTCAPPLE